MKEQINEQKEAQNIEYYQIKLLDLQDKFERMLFYTNKGGIKMKH
jgi:hypothetical protein